MPQIFLCYSHHDAVFAERLARDLVARKIEVWVDKTKIGVGKPFPSEIYAAIHKVDFMVAIVSRSSVASEWVRAELNAASIPDVKRGGGFILPVLIQTVDLPPVLQSRRYADFRESYDFGLLELVAAIEGLEIPPERERAPAPWRRAAVIAVGLLVVAIAAGLLAQRYVADLKPQIMSMVTSSPEGRVIDFANLDVARRTSRTGAASPTLSDYGIRTTNISPSRTLLVVKDSLALYEGKALYPGTQNVLMHETSARAPSAFTLEFARPLRQVSITRTGLYADSVSGISHPAWQARAYDAKGNQIGDAVGEPYIAEHRKVPAATYTLEAPDARIATVRISSDPRNPRDAAIGPAFASVLIERLVLNP
jgi:TIR domain